MKKSGKKTILYIILIIVCIAAVFWPVYARYFPKPRYDIIDLGNFGKSKIYPVAINDFGQIAGYYKDANGIYRSFIYDDSNSFKDIGTLGGNTMAYDINNSGQIAGIATDAEGNRNLFLRDPNDRMTNSGNYNKGRIGVFRKLNNRGQIVGYAVKNDNKRIEAFVWDKEREYIVLGTLGGEESRANSINDKGQVVGESQTADGDRHAFIWDNANGMTDLGTLGGDFSYAHIINNRTHIVGESVEPDLGLVPVLWDQKKQIRPLDILPYYSIIISLNDHGQFLGCYSKTGILWSWLKTSVNVDLFVWSERDGLIDLSGIFLDHDKWEDINLTDINNKGQILGSGQIDGQPHILILNPKEKP